MYKMVQMNFVLFRRYILLNLFVTLLSVSSALAAQASFDRLRIIITTSSDWTVLRLKGDERILEASGISSQGSPEYYWGNDFLQFNQPLENAISGQNVQAQFDVIFESDIVPLITFESTKGDLGIVQIDFFQFNTQTPKLADSVKNTNTASHPNSKTFTVDAKILLEGDFGFSRAQIPRLVLAFYYPWYSLDSLKSPIMRD